MTTGQTQREALWRLDWRFLLPLQNKPFDRLLLLGGTRELAEQLQLLQTARRVDEDLSSHDSVAAVAVLQDAGVTLRQVVTEILPRLVLGGAFYWEIERFPHAPAASPRRVLDVLERNGLHVTGLYAVSPHFREPRVFLPLRAPEALRWYVNTLYEATSLRQTMLERLLSAATGLRAERFARLAPYFALTGVVGHGASGSENAVRCVWGPSIESLLLTDGGNRVTLLPFKPAAATPLGVLKVPKQPTLNDRTIHEQQALNQIRAQVDEKLRHSMPMPLGTIQFGSITAGLESYLPGTSLLRSSGRWGASAGRQIGDLALAADWLIDFHRASCLQSLDWNAAAVHRWVERPLDDFSRKFGLTDAEASLFAYTCQRARQLYGAPLPLVYLHRDFNVWNLYRTQQGLNVIDWEGGQPGLPLCDLLHFVTHWQEAARRLATTETQLQGFRELFVYGDGQRLALAGRAALERYMRALALDPGFYPLLLVYTWVELALRRSMQQRDMGETLQNPRQGNRNFAFIAVLAAATDRLFAGDHHG